MPRWLKVLFFSFFCFSTYPFKLESLERFFFQTDCKPTEEKSVISLVLDVHFPTTTAKQKVFILKNLAEFLNVKKVSVIQF